MCEEYQSYIAGTLRRAYGGRLPREIDVSLRGSAFGQAVRQLVAGVVGLEVAYLEAAVAKAVRMDEQVRPKQRFGHEVCQDLFKSASFV